MTSYFTNWRTQGYSCKACDWRGIGSELSVGEMFNELTELDCPTCGRLISTMTHPALDEMRKNYDKLSDREKAFIDRLDMKAT